MRSWYPLKKTKIHDNIRQCELVLRWRTGLVRRWSRTESWSSKKVIVSCSCNVTVLHCTRNYNIEVVYFRWCYHASLYDPVLNVASVAPCWYYRL
jgi:hypothetical protein